MLMFSLVEKEKQTRRERMTTRLLKLYQLRLFQKYWVICDFTSMLTISIYCAITGIIQTKFPEVVVKDRERQVKDVNKAITKVIAELKGNRLSDGTLKKKGKATILTSEPPSTNNDPEDNEGQSSTNDAAVNSPSAVGEQEIDARRSSIHDNTSAKIIESRPDHPSPIGNHTQQLELPQTSKANCSPMPQERQLLILAPPAPNAPISQPKSSLRLPPNSMLITVEDYLESQVQMSQEALLSQRLHMPDSEDPSIQPSESYSQQLFNERDGWINTRPRPPVGRLIYTQDGSQAIVPPIADSIPMFPPAYNLRPVASSTPKKKIGNGYGRGVSTRSKTDRKLKL